LSVLWCVAVAAVTVVPDPEYGRVPWRDMVQLVPFRVDPLSFLLNVLMFVPFGVLAPLFRRSVDAWRPVLLWAAAASAGIELTQLVLDVTLGAGRTVDVNDLIANAAGALAGYLALRLVRAFSDRRRAPVD
jgi:glycopeptide antibiotics resistance protein